MNCKINTCIASKTRHHISFLSDCNFRWDVACMGWDVVQEFLKSFIHI